MSSSTASMAFLAALLFACVLVTSSANDDFIRFITDSGSVIEIENHQPEAGSPTQNAIQAAPAGMSQEHRIVTRAVKQRFCGEILVNALALVCKGNYKKRGGSGNGISGEESDSVYTGRYMDSQDSYGWPDFYDVLKNANSGYHISNNGNGRNGQPQGTGNELQKGAGAGAHGKLRAKRGVVDECCKRPCSTLTLSQYCSN